MFLPRQELIRRTQRLLDLNDRVVLDALDSSIHSRDLIEEKIPIEGEIGAIFRPATYSAETETAARVRELSHPSKNREAAELEARLSRLTSLEDIRTGLTTMQQDENPGRCNIYDLNGFKVLIDFAHNPAAMGALFDMARAIPAEHCAQM